MDGLRARKKRATRQLISDVATQLFTERGFDHVTIEEVAAAANVSKMTVFNYFARKEDLLFDRTDEPVQLLRDRLANRGSRSPLASLRALVHEMVDERQRFARLTPAVSAFWKVVAESPALRARTREIATELERDLGRLLIETTGGEPGDPIAQLIATLLVGAWRVGYRHALQQRRDPAAREAFLALIDRGFAAAAVLARGTPYGPSNG